MKKRNLVTSLSIVFILSIFILASISMITDDVIGANITNDTTLVKVYVWNTEPNITSVTVSPSSIDLVPGNITTVNCTAIVFDYNGYSDVEFKNATFYHSSSSNNAADDNNNHYSNSTGNCTQLGGSPTNATCIASFSVWYYAYNGTWTCNMTVGDQGGNATSRQMHFNNSNNGSATVSPLLAINVPEEIDYGNLSVTELSDNFTANITNWGNVDINISVRGYGGQDETVPNVGNYSMLCEYGNITHGYQRYSTDSTETYNSMTNLTNISTMLPDFTLPFRTNDTTYENDRNFTYWQIKIPLTVGGLCNGTIVFSATED